MRAGYEVEIATSDYRCGGCGADVDQGEEYGKPGSSSAIQVICMGCIEVFEEEPEQCNHGVQILSSQCQTCGCHYDYCERLRYATGGGHIVICNQQTGTSQWYGEDNGVILTLALHNGWSVTCRDEHCGCHANEVA